MIKLTDILFEGKLSKSQIKKMRDKFDKTGKLPPHLQKLADLMDKHSEIEDIVVPGLEWMADIKEEIVTGGVKSGGSDAGRDIISKMTGGKSSNFGNLSNTSNWAGQHKDGLEFGLKK